MEAVVLCGIQGSGKSTFYTKRFFHTHVRISQDLLRTRHRMRRMLELCLETGVPFVVDRVNATPKERAAFVAPARAAGFRTSLYWLDTPLDKAIARNALRAGRARIPIAAIRGTAKRLIPPRPEEDFDAAFRVATDPAGELLVQPLAATPAHHDERESGRMDQSYLSIYMNDQLAAGVLWRELARRSAEAERGTEAGAELGRVATMIAEDVATFEVIMRRLGMRISRAKPALATAAERVGRLKPNGRFRSRSPLSRFEELDALVMGIDGKVTLWENLRDHAGLAARLPDVDFDHLIERARLQRELLKPHHDAAGAAAFGGVPKVAR